MVTKEMGHVKHADGISWIRYYGNPVLVPDAQWEDDEVDTPCMIKEGTLYKMQYGEDYGIGYASSTNGIHREKYGDNPLITDGGEAFVRSKNFW